MTSGAFTAPYLDAAPWFEKSTRPRPRQRLRRLDGRRSRLDPDAARTRRARRRHHRLRASARRADRRGRGRARLARRSRAVRHRRGRPRRRAASRTSGPSTRSCARVREAESFAYSASVSGTYLSTELFPRLGLAEEVAAKGRRIESERVGAVVARGDAELGFQQISELIADRRDRLRRPAARRGAARQHVLGRHCGRRAQPRRRARARRVPRVARARPRRREVTGSSKSAMTKSDWRALFNGRDLTGWTPKIRKHALGDNYAETFRVRDGVLTVAYDGYDTFDEQLRALVLRRAVLALPAAHRVPVRRRASAERARLGRAQQRRHGALATARDDAARSGLPDLDRGAVPRGLERRQAAADRQSVLAGNARRLRRPARRDALHPVVGPDDRRRRVGHGRRARRAAASASSTTSTARPSSSTAANHLRRRQRQRP